MFQARAYEVPTMFIPVEVNVKMSCAQVLCVEQPTIYIFYFNPRYTYGLAGGLKVLDLLVNICRKGEPK